MVAPNDQAAADAALPEEPLYVVYGGAECSYCVKAAQLLVAEQQHHVKLPSALIAEAGAGAGVDPSELTTIPRIFECPGAHLMLEVSGTEPGALAWTSHNAVKLGACAHVGGYTELAQKIVRAAEALRPAAAAAEAAPKAAAPKALPVPAAMPYAVDAPPPGPGKPENGCVVS